MGLMATLDPVGLWGLPTNTKKLHLEIDYSPCLEVFSQVASETAKGSCPVDTGYLLGSITGGGGTVIASAHYAQYVEYGTWKCPARSFFTAGVSAGAIAAYQTAQQIYQKMLMIEGELMQSMQAGMMGGGMGIGYFTPNPETGMSQARADAILDDYAREHGIVVPGAEQAQNSISLSGAAHIDAAINELGYGTALYTISSLMGQGYGVVAANFGGLFLGGLMTFLGMLFLGSMEKQERHHKDNGSYAIAIPAIQVI